VRVVERNVRVLCMCSYRESLFLSFTTMVSPATTITPHSPHLLSLSTINRYGVVHLSTGDILRAAVQECTALGIKAKVFMDRGELVPDEVIIGVVKERLAAPDCVERGWLLDGFPRTKAQAEALENLGVAPCAFVLLNVPDEMLVERVVGRRTDLETGKIYHLKYSPPPPEIPIERLLHRSDDTEEKVQVRVKAFHEHCDAVAGCYKDVFVQVDGTQKKEAVFAAIKGAIDAALVKEKGLAAAAAAAAASKLGGNKKLAPPRIIIAGAPASGKGTQCEMLKERYGLLGVGWVGWEGGLLCVRDHSALFLILFRLLPFMILLISEDTLSLFLLPFLTHPPSFPPSLPP